MSCPVAGSGKATAGKPDWAHIFLTVLDPLPLHTQDEQEQAATALRAACAGMMSRHSTALRKAGVAQWELRLRVPKDMPAWRIVVSSPTGKHIFGSCQIIRIITFPLACSFCVKRFVLCYHHISHHQGVCSTTSLSMVRRKLGVDELSVCMTLPLPALTFVTM